MRIQAQPFPRSAGAPSSAGQPAIAGGPVRRRRAGPRRRLLRRGEARADASLHGLGLGDLASRRARDRGALPVGAALVARHLHRRARRQRRALLGNSSLPLGSLVGQQTGNMAEIIVGRDPAPPADRPPRRAGSSRAGRRHARGARRSRPAISATVGTVSMLAGGVIETRPRRSRSGGRGGSATPSGGLVVLPLMLAWARDPVAAWRRMSDAGRAPS